MNLSSILRNHLENESSIDQYIQDYTQRIERQMKTESKDSVSFCRFSQLSLTPREPDWLSDNEQRFFQSTDNNHLERVPYLSQCGFITCMLYSPDGDSIIVGHNSGMIQMRHGSTGTVLCTLRNIQFPPKPIYSLCYSKTEERICYASSINGCVYRIEIPNITPSVENPPDYCIRADPGIEHLNTQYYGSPGILSYCTPFIEQRFAALSLGLLPNDTKMVVGYADASIKVYDMETQEVNKKDLGYILDAGRFQSSAVEVYAREAYVQQWTSSGLN